MKLYVGVGCLEEQLLPYEVLKYSINKNGGYADVVIEPIYETREFRSIEGMLKNNYGTVFSMQRFLVPKIAKNRGCDVAIYLDSDILCLKSLSSLIDIVVENSGKIVIPQPNPNYKQPQQSAVFALMVDEASIDYMERMLMKFLNGEIDYEGLMRFSYDTDFVVPCSHVFNSRDFIEPQTVIYHMTDLYCQPWVSLFNRYRDLWFKYLFDAIESNPYLLKLLFDGVRKGWYSKAVARSYLGLPVNFIESLKYLPPQFYIYAVSRYKLIERPGLIGTFFKFMVASYVHCKGLGHYLMRYRGV